MEVTSDTENSYTCSFKGLDVFNIKVEKLVEEIDKISPYDRDHWGLYIFPQIGMRLWRPIIRKEEDFEQEWFKDMSLSNQQDEIRNLYFRTVAIET
ncbi:hypothetical protein [Brevibacillus sp. MS2.2]|uniref:hypothetical protein n=1 Tax=Brevibacillus sp. MS2.2 TaxID=2738981 RepID=UPI00156A86DE|nr:hypothetical protein [Brevibacillus sp. MS2.2]NRR19736.1 hypothetical protein [Brevibacillus sp. MS2.2]